MASDRLHADLLELRTVKDYPDDGDVLLSLGKREVESGFMPKLKSIAANIKNYDTILVGTPVWWGTMAPAVKTFAASFSWVGKKVYPFTTNGGKVGQISADFKKVFSGATVFRPLHVKFDERILKSKLDSITKWIEGFRA